MFDLSYQYGFRIVLVGDSTVGKSTFCRVASNKFNDSKKWDHNSTGLTIGVDFFASIVSIKNKKVQVKLQIWDTAGQEKFRSIIKSYFRNTVGVLLVFDITNRNSFLNIDDWYNDVRRNLDYRNAVYFLVGTKSDLTKLRQVKEEEAKQFAKMHNMSFLETSSKLNSNVNEVFQMIAEQIYDRVQSGDIPSEQNPAISKFSNTNNNTINFPLKQPVDESKSKCSC